MDPVFRNNKSNTRGRPGQFARCVKATVTKLKETLRGKIDYEPLFLTDEEMCIDKCGESVGDLCIAPRREQDIGKASTGNYQRGSKCYAFISLARCVVGLILTVFSFGRCQQYMVHIMRVNLRQLLPSAVRWNQNRWPLKL